ncbi:hypothetical protein BRADI_1g24459v3 [Brachypodium distachyon]|uniref:Uncharacterized protein n=1 Tax=Brachypodium distachyon TaxID=15368 RepID=A0A0Q3JCN2_BRADI|nr:hypothetical protein BRADI_1g24459v3 [Brachypodium distachyon]
MMIWFSSLFMGTKYLLSYLIARIHLSCVASGTPFSMLCNSPLLVIVNMFQNVHNYACILHIFYLPFSFMYFFIRYDFH